MDHLLTIASAERGNGLRWIPSEDRDQALARERYEDSFTSGRASMSRDAWASRGIRLGDVGSMYLFTCTACEH